MRRTRPQHARPCRPGHFARTSIMGLGLLVTTACVTTSTHQATLDELSKTQAELATTRDTLTKERDGVTKQRDEVTKERDELTTQRAETQQKLGKCDEGLTLALDQNQGLITKVSNMGQNVEQLLGEKGELTQERQRLQAEQKQLANEIDELRRMRAAAESRNAQYRGVLDKLQKMVDAGTLQVKVRNGRMVVQMSSDVVFPPGGTSIKSDAKNAISQLAETMKQLPDRKFQVIGHSDPTPINTPRFPSNWELSAQRAIEVVRVMVQAGVPAEMLSAAGASEFDPLVANDSSENKATNRRVEIVFLPKLDELPGFGDLPSSPIGGPAAPSGATATP